MAQPSDPSLVLCSCHNQEKDTTPLPEQMLPCITEWKVDQHSKQHHQWYVHIPSMMTVSCVIVIVVLFPHWSINSYTPLVDRPTQLICIYEIYTYKYKRHSMTIWNYIPFFFCFCLKLSNLSFELISQHFMTKGLGFVKTVEQAIICI